LKSVHLISLAATSAQIAGWCWLAPAPQWRPAA
jgi:hypothetical protein